MLQGLRVITASRSQAALAPQYLLGSTPPASSFFTTPCTASIVPAFSRRHSTSRPAFQSQILLTSAKRRVARPPSDKPPCCLRIRIPA